MFASSSNRVQISQARNTQEEGFRFDSFKESHYKKHVSTELEYQRAKELEDMHSKNGRLYHLSQLGSKQQYVPNTHFLHKHSSDVADLPFHEKMYHLRYEDYFKNYD